MNRLLSAFGICGQHETQFRTVVKECSSWPVLFLGLSFEGAEKSVLGLLGDIKPRREVGFNGAKTGLEINRTTACYLRSSRSCEEDNYMTALPSWSEVCGKNTLWTLRPAHGRERMAISVPVLLISDDLAIHAR